MNGEKGPLVLSHNAHNGSEIHWRRFFSQVPRVFAARFTGVGTFAGFTWPYDTVTQTERVIKQLYAFHRCTDLDVIEATTQLVVDDNLDFGPRSGMLILKDVMASSPEPQDLDQPELEISYLPFPAKKFPRSRGCTSVNRNDGALRKKRHLITAPNSFVQLDSPLSWVSVPQTPPNSHSVNRILNDHTSFIGNILAAPHTFRHLPILLELYALRCGDMLPNITCPRAYTKEFTSAAGTQVIPFSAHRRRMKQTIDAYHTVYMRDLLVLMGFTPGQFGTIIRNTLQLFCVVQAYWQADVLDSRRPGLKGKSLLWQLHHALASDVVHFQWHHEVADLAGYRVVGGNSGAELLIRRGSPNQSRGEAMKVRSHCNRIEMSVSGRGAATCNGNNISSTITRFFPKDSAVILDSMRSWRSRPVLQQLTSISDLILDSPSREKFHIFVTSIYPKSRVKSSHPSGTDGNEKGQCNSVFPRGSPRVVHQEVHLEGFSSKPAGNAHEEADQVIQHSGKHGHYLSLVKNKKNGLLARMGEVARLAITPTSNRAPMSARLEERTNITAWYEHIAYSRIHRYLPEDSFLADGVTIESITLPAPRTYDEMTNIGPIRQGNGKMYSFSAWAWGDSDVREFGYRTEVLFVLGTICPVLPRRGLPHEVSNHTAPHCSRQP
ncbi:hypothetical protein EDB84DRAFT_1673472 [Lactarius hengduanensis]|nr:hypothetical protein EDB84DRAFT_1673472 [Lactarius hengduanensis]